MIKEIVDKIKIISQGKAGKARYFLSNYVVACRIKLIGSKNDITWLKIILFVCFFLFSISKSSYSLFFIRLLSKSKTSELEYIPSHNNKKLRSSSMKIKPFKIIDTAE